MGKNIWDYWAGGYERLWVQKFSLTPTRQMIVSELQDIIMGLPGKISLLDAGCGTGQLIADILGAFPGQLELITGVDTSGKMLEQAREKKLPLASFVPGNAQVLPFPNAHFEVITCCHSFPYYRDKIRALREFARVLKPSGFLLLANASENNLYDKVIMPFVKLTTGKASYPSAPATYHMLSKTGHKPVKQTRVPVKFFMPSIFLSVSKLEADYEYSAGQTQAP